MKKSTRAEIKRIFGNRMEEIEHPFRRNSAGMEWFARMLPLIDELTPKEIDNFLVPLINDLYDDMEGCSLCRAKLLAFAEIYCIHKRVRQSIRFWIRYQECVEHMHGENNQRDFKSEVYDAIEKYLEFGERG